MKAVPLTLAGRDNLILGGRMRGGTSVSQASRPIYPTGGQRLLQSVEALVRHLAVATIVRKSERLQALESGQLFQPRVRHLRLGKVERLQVLELGQLF